MQTSHEIRKHSTFVSSKTSPTVEHACAESMGVEHRLCGGGCMVMGGNILGNGSYASDQSTGTHDLKSGSWD